MIPIVEPFSSVYFSRSKILIPVVLQGHICLGTLFNFNLKHEKAAPRIFDHFKCKTIQNNDLAHFKEDKAEP